MATTTVAVRLALVRSAPPDHRLRREGEVLRGLRIVAAGSAIAAVVAITAGFGSSTASACTPVRSHHFWATPVPRYTWEYANCSIPDIDQRRTGPGGLPDNGHYWCVPTSTMNLMAWLAHWGYLRPAPFGVPGDKDWTDPLNFDEMSADLKLMGEYMGTDPTSGTNPGGREDGIEQWLEYQQQGVPTGLPLLTKAFEYGRTSEDSPNFAGLAAAKGALVLVTIGRYDSSGDRTGGHEVTFQQGIGDTSAGSISIHVMDPNVPGIDDHVQSAYHRDLWVLSPYSGVRWSLANTVYDPTQTFYNGYVTIEPEVVASSDAPRIVVDTPFTLVESRRHPRRATVEKLPAGTEVTDLALSPPGFGQFFLRGGSNAVWRFDTLSDRTTRFAAGPEGAAHLTFGGPDETLFVSGVGLIEALSTDGKVVGSVQVPSAIDALTYDDHAGRLVALSAAERRLLFFSPSLQPEGSAPVPASVLSGRGGFSIGVAADGSTFVHRDGSPVVGATKGASTEFRVVKLAARAANARGLAVDDYGDLLVSARGRLVELLRNGRVLRGSRFDGMPAQGIVRVSRSFSNMPESWRDQ